MSKALGLCEVSPDATVMPAVTTRLYNRPVVSSGKVAFMIANASLPPCGTFDIVADDVSRFLHITLGGFWQDEIFEQYRTALRAATRAMMAIGGYRGALVDTSSYSIQPQTIAAGHAEAMRLARTMYGVRAAVLMPAVCSRLQMNRLAEETGHRAFDRRDDAIDWLMS